MDAGLRQLLLMQDEEILEAVERDRASRAERTREIERLVEMLPREAPEEERHALRRFQQQLRFRRVVPDPVLAAAKGVEAVGVVSLVQFEVVVRFCGNRDDLAAMGLKVGASAQDIFVVTGNRFQLADLAAQPATLSLRLPRLVFPAISSAGVQSQVHEAQKPLWQFTTGYRGKGVIVGVIDLPLDVTHHAFRKANGDTRVLYYWVQRPDQADAAGETPGKVESVFEKLGLDYGRLYKADDINTAIHSTAPYGPAVGQISCNPWVVDGHGTYVTGIAAGSPPATDATRAGAAPEADLVYVAYDWTDGNFDTKIVEAIKFMCRVADLEEKPLVMNLSQGWQDGPHDGTDEVSYFLENELNSVPWRSVVVAAGNDGNKDCYRRGKVPKGGAAEFAIRVDDMYLDLVVILDIWYQGPRLSVQVHFRPPYNEPTPWIETSGNFLKPYTFNVHTEELGEKRRLKVAFLPEPKDPADPNSKKYFKWAGTPHTIIRLQCSDPSSEVSYDAWTGLQGGNLKFDDPTKDTTSLSDNACGRFPLSVGACWKLADPLNPSAPRPPDPSQGEEISGYSGRGPTADGRVKPELVTVGGDYQLGMITAKPDPKSQDQYTDLSGHVWGTSLAAPLVTGAVAQLLEALKEPHLWLPPSPLPPHPYQPPDQVFQEDIKGLLTRAAYRGDHDPKKDPNWQNKYGFGRLRVLDAIKQFKPVPQVELWIKRGVGDAGADYYPGSILHLCPDIKVYLAVPGPKQEVYDLVFGKGYRVEVTARNLGLDQAYNVKVQLYWSRYATGFVKFALAGEATLAPPQSIPALGSWTAPITFVPRPQDLGYVEDMRPDWNHFCLLARLDSPNDHGPDVPLTQDPGDLDIKNHNNLGLRNVTITTAKKP
jgi:subtilisin family serine protease